MDVGLPISDRLQPGYSRVRKGGRSGIFEPGCRAWKRMVLPRRCSDALADGRAGAGAGGGGDRPRTWHRQTNRIHRRSRARPLWVVPSFAVGRRGRRIIRGAAPFHTAPRRRYRPGTAGRPGKDGVRGDGPGASEGAGRGAGTRIGPDAHLSSAAPMALNLDHVGGSAPTSRSSRGVSRGAGLGTMAGEAGHPRPGLKVVSNAAAGNSFSTRNRRRRASGSSRLRSARARSELDGPRTGQEPTRNSWP